MRISDWSSDVCSSDLPGPVVARRQHRRDGDRTDGLRRKCARLSLQPRVPAGPDRHADARAQGRMTMAAGLSIFDISGRALSAQLVRLNTTASNLANAGTVAGREVEARSAERRVGKGGVRTGRSRWGLD